MELEKAQKIVSEMYLHFLFHQGLVDEVPPRLEYSLKEMLEANEIVSKYNDTRTDGAGSMTIAERGIAAMYVAMSFPNKIGDAQIETIAYANGFYVFVVEKEMMDAINAIKE